MKQVVATALALLLLLFLLPLLLVRQDGPGTAQEGAVPQSLGMMVQPLGNQACCSLFLVMTFPRLSQRARRSARMSSCSSISSPSARATVCLVKSS